MLLTWESVAANINYARSLFAVQKKQKVHVAYSFLSELTGAQRIGAWLDQVPDQLDRIRLHRNSAVHNEKRFHLADAQEVRGVLFTEGLLAQMSFLLSRTAQRQP